MKAIIRALLIGFLLFITEVNIYAQSGILPFVLELRGGTNLSDMSIRNSKTNNMAGYHVGIAAELPLPADFYLHSGILFSTKGATEVNTTEGDRRINANYFQIPAMFGFRPQIVGNLNFKILTGVYFAQGVGGGIHQNGRNIGGTFDTHTGLQRFDFGWAIGTGLDYRRLSFTLGYERGLIDVAHGTSRIRNTNRYMSFGYKFY